MTGEKSKKKQFFASINKAEDLCLVGMFAIMVAAIFLQIVMRFIFNNSLVWSEELGKFIFVWISWLGISIGERKNEHIKITMVVDKFSPKWQKIFEIISYIILLGILLVTFYYAYTLVGSQHHVNYAGIKISVSWGYLSLVLGCAFMALRVIAVIYYDVKAIIQRDYEAVSHPYMIDQIEAQVDAYTVEEEGGIK